MHDAFRLKLRLLKALSGKAAQLAAAARLLTDAAAADDPLSVVCNKFSVADRRVKAVEAEAGLLVEFCDDLEKSLEGEA